MRVELFIIGTVLITNASGEKEDFQAKKLRRSLVVSGAPPEVADEVVAHVLGELKERMTTDEIYAHAFEFLKRRAEKPVAARYSLRRAIMGLGPSGFPFESYLAELLKTQGYGVQTGVQMKGRCASHEIDVVGSRGDDVLIVEAKFHNRTGYKTDLKTALYVYARFRDLAEAGIGECTTDGTPSTFALITNTKFTTNAKRYARCAGCLRLIGWDYPHKRSLKSLIEDMALHPLTALTTLSEEEKRALFSRGIVLCQSIVGEESILKEAGISAQKAREVKQEAALLCLPRASDTVEARL